MKLHILSDLHIEFAKFKPLTKDNDIVILAGDIHVGERGLAWAKQEFKNQEVIYVLGNHEYYNQEIPGLTKKLIQQSKGTNVHILENESLTIGDITFSGCTLWTDFLLFNNLNVAIKMANKVVNDYNLINISNEKRKLKPSDTIIWHKESRLWLEQELKTAKKQNKKSVVITHNAPSILSVPDCYKNDQLSAAFASEMKDFIENLEPDLWVHGHIHNSSDFHIGRTRVICNPRGYIPNQPNKDFNPELFVEI